MTLVTHSLVLFIFTEKVDFLYLKTAIPAPALQMLMRGLKGREYPFLIHPRAEDVGTDAYHRGAVSNGDGKVGTHAPRALAEGVIVGKELLLHLVEEAAPRLKLSSNL